MGKASLGIPKGTRDHSPEKVIKRNYIFNTIRAVFERFGFQPIETPSFENLSTLTGKYGDEGDKLIFKILNSGNFLKGSQLSEAAEELYKLDAGRLPKEALVKLNQYGAQLSEKALRYDLTVPFARYVVMHQNDLQFPFKRYQIQPVWRADRPQKGRYREFFQCDVDIIGSDSLVNEVELVMIFDEALSNLGIEDFTVKLNNRKILAGLVEHIGASDQFMAVTIALDKFDKIGNDGVRNELKKLELSDESIHTLLDILAFEGDAQAKLNQLSGILTGSELGMKGIEEMQFIFDKLAGLEIRNAKLDLDIKLARGLNYYTGCIFEVSAGGVDIGSICGGGRYDDLTGIFGLPNVSGVGISFGADRIYDVMEALELFEDIKTSASDLLICCLDNESQTAALQILQKLRSNGIDSEIYPDVAKLKKQMKYAGNRGVSYALLIGSRELEEQCYSLKNMQTGEQMSLSLEDIIKKIKH